MGMGFVKSRLFTFGVIQGSEVSNDSVHNPAPFLGSGRFTNPVNSLQRPTADFITSLQLPFPSEERDNCHQLAGSWSGSGHTFPSAPALVAGCVQSCKDG